MQKRTYSFSVKAFLTTVSFQVKDTGVYLAKVVSAAGECSSSPLYVEVLPGPEWKGSEQGDYYGAKMDTVPAESGEEADATWDKFGIRTSYKYFIPFSFAPSPTGWMQGTVGSWEVKTSLEERKDREEEGKRAMYADNRRKVFSNWLLEQSFAKSEAEIEWRRTMSLDFDVTEDVGEALVKIWTEQCWNLHIELELNFDALNKVLCDEDDWPDQPLLKSREKMLVETSLIHTWETHLQWEQEQAEAWGEDFAVDQLSKLRWRGFRCKRLMANRQTCSSDTSSSSESLSDSDEEEERKEQSRLKAWDKINFDSECSMSMRIGEEAQREQSSDEESSDNADEEDAIARLQSFLLRSYEKEEDQVSPNPCVSRHL